MDLHSPQSAILSAVIFNAIIIPMLIPLALRGVEYKPIGASALLSAETFADLWFGRRAYTVYRH